MIYEFNFFSEDGKIVIKKLLADSKEEAYKKADNYLNQIGFHDWELLNEDIQMNGAPQQKPDSSNEAGNQIKISDIKPVSAETELPLSQVGQANLRWVKASERLPEKGKLVLWDWYEEPPFWGDYTPINGFKCVTLYESSGEEEIMEIDDKIDQLEWLEETTPTNESFDAGNKKAPIDVEALKPKVVCLCGSTRFMDAFQAANLKLTCEGIIVLSVGCNTKSDRDLLFSGELTEELKIRLDELHKRKIDLSDEVFILNVGGYIGESTRNELEYALLIGKPVTYLEPIS